jgi:hypothetical protein
LLLWYFHARPEGNDKKSACHRSRFLSNALKDKVYKKKVKLSL